MKKILLIEDRSERQLLFMNKTNINFESYFEILENATGKQYEELFVKLKRGDLYFNDYAIVMTHKSAFADDNKDILHKIKELCQEQKIPLVLFSGGVSTNYYDKTEDLEIMELNSKDFYSENLKLFLEKFRQHGQIELLILSYGNNWELNILLNTIEKIHNFIALNEDEDILYDEFVNSTDFHLLENLEFDYHHPSIEDGWIYLSEIKETASSIEDYIKKSILYEK